MRITKPLTIVLAALSLAGCGGRHQPDSGIIPDDPTVLTVENDNFYDMRIYVHRGSQRLRVGTANGKSTTPFKLSKTLVVGVMSLRFEAVPIGGRGASISEEIPVSPGDSITMRIPPL
jgi:hypothetical protein